MLRASTIGRPRLDGISSTSPRVTGAPVLQHMPPSIAPFGVGLAIEQGNLTYSNNSAECFSDGAYTGHGDC